MRDQAASFAESGLSVSVGYDPTPDTPLSFTARVAPTWGNDAMNGAEALCGQETMSGMNEAVVAGADRARLDHRGRLRPADRQAVRRHAAGRRPDFGVRPRLPHGLQRAGPRGGARSGCSSTSKPSCGSAPCSGCSRPRAAEQTSGWSGKPASSDRRRASLRSVTWASPRKHAFKTRRQSGPGTSESPSRRSCP